MSDTFVTPEYFFMQLYRLLFILLLSLFASCVPPTYFDTMKPVHIAFQSNQYDIALKELEQNKYLKKAFNQQLYHTEKGRLLQLSGRYKDAVKELNEADHLADSWKEAKVRLSDGGIFIAKSNIKDIDNLDTQKRARMTQMGTYNLSFKRPNRLKYRAEHPERFIIHYLKAMCFIEMNNKDAALVEAKRMLLLATQLDDLRQAELNYNVYVPDPFPYYLSGIIFEYLGSKDDARISYEKALKCYARPGTKVVYGVELPTQLKLAHERVTAEKQTSEKILILFIETGTTPYKDRFAEYFLYDTVRQMAVRSPNETGYAFYYPNVKSNKPADMPQVYTNKQAHLIETLQNNEYWMNHTLNMRTQYEYSQNAYKVSMYVKSKDHNSGQKYQNLDTRNSQLLMSQIKIATIPLKNGENTIQITNSKGVVIKELKIIPEEKIVIKHFYLD